MAIDYPSAIDVFTNPSGTSTLDSPDHSLQHSDANDAIEAIEAVIGTTAGTSVLKDFSAGEFAVRQEGGTVSPGTLTFDSPTLGTPAITGGTATGLTLAGTPVLDATSAIPFYNDSIHRQAILNGNFDVWQRGTSVAIADITNTFLADRWLEYTTKDGGTAPTLTRSRQVLTSGNISNAFFYTRLTTNGAGTSLGANSQHQYTNKIENGTRYLCGDGKKVTVSFWARSDIANKRICPTLNQTYGTGGSPSTGENIQGTPITLTSTWTKYAVTFTTNTLSGKTFGTNYDDYLSLRIYLMWGSTYGNTFVQTGVSAETYVGNGNIDIAQVQLCAGDVALPFMPKSFEEELRACQRYYEKSYDYTVAPGTSTIVGSTQWSSAGGNYSTTTVFFKVAKRVTPTTVAVYSTAGTVAKIRNLSAGSDVKGKVENAGENSMSLTVDNDSTTVTQTLQAHWTANAEL